MGQTISGHTTFQQIPWRSDDLDFDLDHGECVEEGEVEGVLRDTMMMEQEVEGDGDIEQDVEIRMKDEDSPIQQDVITAVEVPAPTSENDIDIDIEAGPVREHAISSVEVSAPTSVVGVDIGEQEVVAAIEVFTPSPFPTPISNTVDESNIGRINSDAKIAWTREKARLECRNDRIEDRIISLQQEITCKELGIQLAEDRRYLYYRFGTEEEKAQAEALAIAQAEIAVAKKKAELAQLHQKLADRRAQLALGITELEELPDPVLIELPVIPLEVQDYRNGLTDTLRLDFA